MQRGQKKTYGVILLCQTTAGLKQHLVIRNLGARIFFGGIDKNYFNSKV